MTDDAGGDEGDVPRSDAGGRVGDDVVEGGPNKWTTPGDGGEDAEDADGDAEDVPLSELARRIERRRSDDAAGDDADSASPFESMSVEEVDSEALWAGLVESETDAQGLGTGGLAEAVDDDLPGREDHVVPKAEFCQQCPHFADPPELACTHRGTEIVEVVDTDRFRVRDCPMVDGE